MSRLDEHTASASPEPPPPTYRALRMAAEWASAVRNQQLAFTYDTDTGHMVLDGPGAAGTLPVFTTSFTSRPTVTALEFSVPGTAGGDPPPLRVPVDEASALFWSESAVEKFLVPYLASIAADDAPRFLGRLFDAWYGYPGDVVQVCAITYLCGRTPPTPGTPLSLARTVGLVCLEGGTRLTLLTLDEFTARYPTGLAPGAGAIAGSSDLPDIRQGWEVGQQAESVVARDVAEFVSGMRGHFVAFTTYGTSLIPEVYPGESPPSLLGTPLFTALARPVRRDRPAPSGVVVWVQQTPQSPAVQKVLIPGDGDPAAEFLPDALFWSDGSVEKLLLPYYASVKGGGSWFFELCLMAKWDGLIDPSSCETADLKEIVAGQLDRFAHAASHAAGRTDVAADPSTVYATMHLPRSEYADEVEARTVVLSLKGEALADDAVWLPQRGDAGGPVKRSRKTASRAT
jgi:hypothetical protein